MKADPAQIHIAKEFKHDSPLIACRFDPSGQYVFATAEDRSVLRWNLAAEKEEKVVLKKHDSWVGALAFSKDGKTLITAGYDDTLIWWPTAAAAPEPVRSVKAHEGWIRSIAVSPDGTLLASAGNDKMVKLWNLADGKLVREMPGHAREVYSVAFHPSGEFLLSGDLKGVVNQWEVATGKLARSLDGKTLNTYDKGQDVDYGGVRGMEVRPDGKQLACIGLYKATNPLGAINEPLTLRFDWEKGTILRSHVGEAADGIGWRCLFHPDGFLIGGTGGKNGGFALFWKEDADKAFHQFKYPELLRDMDLHPDGIQLATAHSDQKLRISRMEAKKA